MDYKQIVDYLRKLKPDFKVDNSVFDSELRRTIEGITPLMFVLEYDIGYEYQDELIDLLLKQSDFDINFQDNCGKTALMYSIYYSDEYDEEYMDIPMKILSKNGIDVNIQDNQGTTAMMYAISNIFEDEVIEKMLKLGYNVNIKDNVNKTAYDYAEEKGEYDEEILELLKPKPI